MLGQRGAAMRARCACVRCGTGVSVQRGQHMRLRLFAARAASRDDSRWANGVSRSSAIQYNCASSNATSDDASAGAGGMVTACASGPSRSYVWPAAMLSQARGGTAGERDMPERKRRPPVGGGPSGMARMSAAVPVSTARVKRVKAPEWRRRPVSRSCGNPLVKVATQER